MSEFKFSCSHCGQHIKCDDQFSGRQIQCPACNVMIRIPPAPGKTADFKPQSGMTWDTFMPKSGKSAPGQNPEAGPGKPSK